VLTLLADLWGHLRPPFFIRHHFDFLSKKVLSYLPGKNVLSGDILRGVPSKNNDFSYKKIDDFSLFFKNVTKKQDFGF
jgi:hypothetical protein